MTVNRSRSTLSRSSVTRNGSGRSVATKGSHVTSRSRSRTSAPAPEKRGEQILVELRRQGSIVNSPSGRSSSQTRARSLTRSRSQVSSRRSRGQVSSRRSRSQTRARSLTRSPSQISGFKGTQSHTGMARSVSQTRLSESVSVGNKSRSSRNLSQNGNSVKENKKQGRLIRGRMARTVESGSDSSKSSERKFQSKIKTRKFDVNGKTAIITMVKSPNDLAFGRSTSSEDSLLKKRNSRTNKMRSPMVGRSKEVSLTRNVSKVHSGTVVGTNEEEDSKKKSTFRFRAIGLGKRGAFVSAEKMENSNKNYPSLSLEESREMPSVIEGISGTISTLDSTDGTTHRGMVDEYNEIFAQRAQRELAEIMRKELEEKQHKELEQKPSMFRRGLRKMGPMSFRKMEQEGVQEENTVQDTVEPESPPMPEPEEEELAEIMRKELEEKQHKELEQKPSMFRRGLWKMGPMSLGKMEQEEVQEENTVQDTVEPESPPLPEPEEEEEEENKENSSVMGVLESNFYIGAYFLGEKADVLLSQAVYNKRRNVLPNELEGLSNSQGVADRNALEEI